MRTSAHPDFAASQCSPDLRAARGFAARFGQVGRTVPLKRKASRLGVLSDLRLGQSSAVRQGCHA